MAQNQKEEAKRGGLLCSHMVSLHRHALYYSQLQVKSIYINHPSQGNSANTCTHTHTHTHTPFLHIMKNINAQKQNKTKKTHTNTKTQWTKGAGAYFTPLGIVHLRLEHV